MAIALLSCTVCAYIVVACHLLILFSRDHFYQFGEIRLITMVPKQQCAFVCFTNRYSAETAAERSFNKLIVKGRRLKILWGKSQGAKAAPGNEGGAKLTPVPGLPEGKYSIQLKK